ncbi:PD-(D/E)XK nuclease family protein [Halobacteriovorax sp. HLS]|uniref:PD-(D/E)XK nuclease family protein n=1 Tax=Halobacteriovorax sp. HLS TaxID=2234000 RepID=UPI0013E3C6D0|nr:PD-(D/E)XK nuclease family protein [Halobacteriovorax sp. HLS]
MSKRYCREISNIGYIPCTLRSLVEELYNHPSFFLENTDVEYLNHHELDLKLCEIHQKLKADNYFHEAMKIRGNRGLILNALEELRLSLDGTSIDNLKLEDPHKSSSLIELYTLYRSEDLADYSKVFFSVLERLKIGKYDSLLRDIRITFLDDVEVVGYEKVLIELLEEKISITRFSSKEIDADLSKVSCSSSITANSSIRNTFRWMHENKFTSDNTKLVALNYDLYANELYKLKEEMPVYLERGLKCSNFSFFESFMTTLATQNKNNKEQDIFLNIVESLVRMRSEEKEQTELFRVFYKLVLNIVSDLKLASNIYLDLKIPIDAYEILSKEVSDLNFTSIDLDLDQTGLTLCSLDDCYALSCENIAVLGLEHGNYPKRQKIDPLLKKNERDLINKSTDAILIVDAYRVEDMLGTLIKNSSGQQLLTYESHNLETGKLKVPSTFFNKVLKAQGKEIKIENIYDLCNVKEQYVTDLKEQGVFLNTLSNEGLMTSINNQASKLYSKEVEDIDFGVSDNFKKDLSASSLENFYHCPYRFNLRSNLKVYPPELEEVDKSYWLDAMSRGTFLHKAYENLLKPFCVDDGLYSEYLGNIKDADIKKAIEGALDSKLNKEVTFREYNLDVPEYVRQEELTEMSENLVTFLAQEIEKNDSFYPIAHEYEFNFKWVLDGVELLFDGLIDRVDTDGKGNYRVVDYKTGKNPFKSEKQYLFVIEGKKLRDPYKVYFQHALYTKALLESEFSKDIKSIEAGYYFTSDRGDWTKVYHDGQTPEKKFENILKTYISEASTGKYFKNSTQCYYCDYKQICAGKQEKRERIDFEQLVNLKNAVMED